MDSVFLHRCASVARMSACSFCCSFTRWFRLFIFNLFCGVFELLVQVVVWHPLHLFCMDEKFGLSPALKWFNSSGLLHFSYGSGFHGTKDCPQAGVLNFFPVCCCASRLLSPRRWLHIPEMVGLLPCRWFLESWSWHPCVFQTISSRQQAS